MHASNQPMRILFGLILSLSIGLLSACGGGGGTGDGELIGTGMHGTSAVGEAIANATVTVKSLDGLTTSTQTDAQGKFETPRLDSQGPFLLRVEQANGDYLYSIAHKQGTGAEMLTANIHPYTDLILRNWFAKSPLDIDTIFTSDQAINTLPDASAIDNNEQALQDILAKVLTVSQTPSNFDFFTSEFDANQTGFDQLLDLSEVIIKADINQQLSFSIVIQDPISKLKNLLINGLTITIDFTNNNNQAPTQPQAVRALAASTSEAFVVWQASSDDIAVAYYKVYRNGAYIGDTPFPVYLDQGLSTQTNYSYTVVAVDNQDLESSESLASNALVLNGNDTTAPDPASNLSISVSSASLNLSWDQNGISDVAGFKVMRSNGNGVKQQIAKVSATQWQDYAISPASNYCYEIISYDAAGNDASASNEACATSAGITTGNPSVGFAKASYNVNESSSLITVNVIRGGNLQQAIELSYSTSDASANAGSDYQATSGNLSWGANDNTPRSIDITIESDSLIEGSESFFITLASNNNTIIWNQQQSQVIISDALQLSCQELVTTDITTDTTLSKACYEVDNDIEVSDGATLIIAPGSRLEFASGRGLDIESDGRLIAIGTAQEPIIFTGEFAAAGYWDGIEIESLATSNLSHVIVEYGGNDSSFNEANIGLSFDGRASIDNSVIRHSANYGVSLDNGELLTSFENNTVTNNQAAPISISANNASVIAANNQLSGNSNSQNQSRDYVDINETSLSQDQTWQTLDVPYRMSNGAFDIEAQLTLSPGTVLEFPSTSSQLNIDSDGTLKAAGTALDPITFTSVAGNKTPGAWRGIQFTFSGTDNVLDHTVVEYAGAAGGNTQANVGVFGQNGKLTLTNSTVRFSDGFGFEFNNNIDLVMDNVVSENNAISGSITINDIHMLSANSRYINNTDNRIQVIERTINTAQTIKDVGVAYYFTPTATINVNADTTIAAGVEIEFNNGGGFNVDASSSLDIAGTAENKVLLTGATKAKGYWKGIQYTFSSGNAIDHAIIEYAGANGGNTQALVGFFGQNTQGSISNTTFRGSLNHGIWLDDDTIGSFDQGNSFEDIDGMDTFLEN